MNSAGESGTATRRAGGSGALAEVEAPTCSICLDQFEEGVQVCQLVSKVAFPMDISANPLVINEYEPARGLLVHARGATDWTGRRSAASARG